MAAVVDDCVLAGAAMVATDQRIMNNVYSETPFDAAPEIANAAIRAHQGPVFVDLDETLYLRNSTEDFIDLAWPGIFALLLMRFLDVLRPWRWTGGEPTRDVWRVRAVSIFFPWTASRWRARVAQLAKEFTNWELLEALQARPSPPTIVSVGFRSIVVPLVNAMGFTNATIVAARSDTFRDRSGGKLNMAIAALGEDSVRKALVVTDSKDDLPLLQACSRPLRTIWPTARYRQAFSAIYLPGQYISRVKHPGERYIFRGILQEDFAFWVLSSVALAANPTLHVLGLALLLVSFWVIYERGYVDNDLAAASFETDPKLSQAFRQLPVATPAVQPWIWSCACAAGALFLLHSPTRTLPVADLIKWLGVIVATYLWFKLYNRFDKATRVWMFAVLQFARGAAPVAVVAVMPIGAAALGAHVIARWVPYQIYRFAGRDWPDTKSQLARLLFFVMLALLVGVSSGWSAVFNWSALALFLWMLFRARDDIAGVLRDARRLDRGGNKKS